MWANRTWARLLNPFSLTLRIECRSPPHQDYLANHAIARLTVENVPLMQKAHASIFLVVFVRGRKRLDLLFIDRLAEAARLFGGDCELTLTTFGVFVCHNFYLI